MSFGYGLKASPWGCCLLIACERGSSGSIGSKEVGAAPDPSTQFSLLCLYIFEHPTFHSAQDDEMRRGVEIMMIPEGCI